jgi:geranylgeranyl diphosphate synthase type II
MFEKYIENELIIYYNTIKHSKLRDIIKYSLDGGKAIRGGIVKHIIETLSGKECNFWQPIVSIELIHGISLVIDDLPCMDNDLIRRNKPSTFARYGERHALLVSLYGISEAFNILIKGIQELNIDCNEYINIINNIISDWHEYIGKNLIVGQMLDLKENVEELLNIKITNNNINIMLYKTCSLFIFTFVLGGLFSGVKVNLDDYKLIGYYIGCMYQIMDDSRDVETDIKEANIVLNQGPIEANLLYLESKSKLLDLLEKNNIVTEELMNLINTIDNMLKI